MHLISEEGEGDAAAVRLSARERLGHVRRLIERDPRRHRRLVWIDDSLDECRTLGFERRFQRVANLLRLLTPESHATTRFGKLHEVDRLQLDAVFWISEEDHLLPLDHA